MNLSYEFKNYYVFCFSIFNIYFWFGVNVSCVNLMLKHKLIA